MLSNMETIKPFMDAIRQYVKFGYSNFGADYSVTTLIQPPRIVQLQRRYADEIAQKPIDIKKVMGSFRGTAIHDKFERTLWQYMNENKHENYLLERRLWDRICDRKISGKFDAYFNGTLYDWKTTSVWKRLFNDFTNYEQQGNIYAYMLRQVGLPVHTICIIAWYMNWEAKKVYERGYPKDEVEPLFMPVWSDEQQEEFLCDRIELHKYNEDLSDDCLSQCTRDEMWVKEDKFAVYLKGEMGVKGKKAKRVLNTIDEARDWIAQKLDGEYEIQFRAGERTRCEEWCDVKEWCSQYKEYREAQSG